MRVGPGAARCGRRVSVTVPMINHGDAGGQPAHGRRARSCVGPLRIERNRRRKNRRTARALRRERARIGTNALQSCRPSPCSTSRSTSLRAQRQRVEIRDANLQLAFGPVVVEPDDAQRHRPRVPARGGFGQHADADVRVGHPARCRRSRPDGRRGSCAAPRAGTRSSRWCSRTRARAPSRRTTAGHAGWTRAARRTSPWPARRLAPPGPPPSRSTRCVYHRAYGAGHAARGGNVPLRRAPRWLVSQRGG